MLLPSESTHALSKYCPNTDWSKLVFISDRHRGILSGIKKHFPEAHHLYCVVHILRNLFTKGMNVFQYWQAVEATNKEEFEAACANIPQSPKLFALIDEAEHWSRFAIQAMGVKRFGVRANNWAESQNNAMRLQRTGQILDVLISAFRYTSMKISTFRRDATLYRESGNRGITKFARKVFLSNFKFALRCSVDQYSSREWRVREFNAMFTVKVSTQGTMTCSCHRFFDEGIPCQHLMKAIDFAQMGFRPSALIYFQIHQSFSRRASVLSERQ